MPKAKDTPADIANLTAKEIDVIPFRQLRKICVELKLGGAGTTEALRRRLKSYVSSSKKQDSTSSSSYSSSDSSSSSSSSSSSDSEDDDSSTSSSGNSTPENTRNQGSRGRGSATRRGRGGRSNTSRRSALAPSSKSSKLTSAKNLKSAPPSKAKTPTTASSRRRTTPAASSRAKSVTSPTIASRAADLAGSDVSFPVGLVSPRRRVTKSLGKAATSSPFPIKRRPARKSTMSSAADTKQPDTHDLDSGNSSDASALSSTSLTRNAAPSSAGSAQPAASSSSNSSSSLTLAVHEKDPEEHGPVRRSRSSLIPSPPAFFVDGKNKPVRAARKSTTSSLQDEMTAKYANRRASLRLWKRPGAVLYLTSLVMHSYFMKTMSWINSHGLVILFLGTGSTAYLWARASAGASHGASFTDLPEPTHLFEDIEAVFEDIVWWGGLGVISAIGLGSGVPTFILYLGPHLLALATTTHECSEEAEAEGGFVKCLSAVWYQGWWPAVLWGIGTALGELPPYFVARAAAAHSPVEESVIRCRELAAKKHLSFGERIEYWQVWAQAKSFDLVQYAGFFGILLFASVPNPLFDLAGMISGYLGISFWTFFFATLIGKGIIKVNLQVLGLAIAGSEPTLRIVSELFTTISGGYLNITPMVLQMRESLGKDNSDEASLFKQLWGWFLVLVISNFVVSVIHAEVVAYQQEQDERKIRRVVKNIRDVNSGKKDL